MKSVQSCACIEHFYMKQTQAHTEWLPGVRLKQYHLLPILYIVGAGDCPAFIPWLSEHCQVKQLPAFYYSLFHHTTSLVRM